MLAITEPMTAWQQLQDRALRERHHPADGRQWFVLLCEPQMERKAAARLIGERFKVYLPECLVWTTRGIRRRKVQAPRPMFRGYLFIRLSLLLDPFTHASSAVGVHKFLKFGEDFAIVPDEVMRRIGMIEQELMTPKQLRGPSAMFHVGEAVRVAEGTFSGFNADIIRLDDEERITILLPLLGRAVPVTLEAEQLEKL